MTEQRPSIMEQRILRNGSKKLKNGMAEFDSEAVRPITEKLGDKLDEAYDLIYDIAKEGEKYNNYSGISEGMDGSVQNSYTKQMVLKKPGRNKLWSDLVNLLSDSDALY